METLKLWQSILGEIELQISKPTYATFFAGTLLVSLENGVATIGCPNPVAQKMIETRYYSLIKNILDKKTLANNSLVFTIKKSQETKEAGPLFAQEKTVDNRSLLPAGLHPFYTFENFAVSSSNQVAYAAAQAVVKTPGTAYNPLFIYGGVGVGKTHLIQAIARAILEKNLRLKFIYCTSEEFTNDFIEAIRQKNTNFFKNRYRGVSLLLIDDIQFIGGKEKVQEELFHTFNSLQKDNSQVVLTSDRPPTEIPKLEDRLRSRFDGGLTIDIAPPDFELRTAILLIKARALGVEIPMDIAQFIAANIEDTRRLEGFLRRLLTEAETKKVPLSLALAQSILGKPGELEEAPKRRVGPEEVLAAVTQRFGLKISHIKGPKRDKSLAFPRQVAMHILRVDCKYPLITIGQALGGRDHTTVMYGVEKISTLLSTDEKLREDISWIKSRIWGSS